MKHGAGLPLNALRSIKRIVDISSDRQSTFSWQPRTSSFTLIKRQRRLLAMQPLLPPRAPRISRGDWQCWPGRLCGLCVCHAGGPVSDRTSLLRQLPPQPALATRAMMFAAMATFDQGGVVPRTQMALVHGGERVLTERQNQSLNQAVSNINNNNNGGIHYHAARGESPDSVTRNAAALQRMMRDGARFA